MRTGRQSARTATRCRSVPDRPQQPDWKEARPEPSLHGREAGRLEKHVLDRGNDRPVALALGALGDPFGIGNELIPLALTLRKGFPRQEIVKVLIAAVADQHRPEPRLPDTVALPQLESGALEAFQQSRQTSDHTVINPQFVDHAALLLYGASLIFGPGHDYTRRL